MTKNQIEELLRFLYQYGLSEMIRELRESDVVLNEFSVTVHAYGKDFTTYVRAEIDKENGTFVASWFEDPGYINRIDVNIEGTFSNGNSTIVIKDLGGSISFSYTFSESGILEFNAKDYNDNEYGGTFRHVEGSEGEWECETKTDLGVDVFNMEVDKQGNVIKFERH